MSKLDQIPEEVRAKIAAVLLKSIGAGPIEAPGSDDDDDGNVQVLSASMEGLEGALAVLTRGHQGERRSASELEVAMLNLRPIPPFKVGDRVRWKPGYRHGEWPGEGQAVIVSQVIDPPLYDASAADTGKGAQRNDIALAFADDGGDGPPRVFEFIYDSRRFERVEE